jgi:hypothetical protein
MTETRTVGTGTEVVTEFLAAADGDVLAVLARPAAVRGLVTSLDDVAFDHQLRLITDESTARAIRSEFLTATRVVDLIEDGTVRLRTVSGDRAPLDALLIGPDRLASLLWSRDDRVGSLEADDGEFPATFRAEYDEVWEGAEEYSFRTPAYSRMLESLGERLGEGTQADLATALEADVTRRGLESNLDAVDVTILVAARNRHQLYELSRWGESSGLASPAKFSQAKQRLEDVGLLKTEKVPQERGRPRQRLVLAKGDLEDASVEELIGTAQSVTAS